MHGGGRTQRLRAGKQYAVKEKKMKQCVETSWDTKPGGRNSRQEYGCRHLEGSYRDHSWAQTL